MIIALDLSLTCTGCVAAPIDWRGDWETVVVRELRAEPLPKLKKGETRLVSEVERTIRIGTLSMQIFEWCKCWGSIGPKSVHFEQRSFVKCNAANGQTAALAEITKFNLARAGIDFYSTPSTEARKLLLGKVPRCGQDAKDAVQATFRTAGCPVEWGQDITDALCIMNHAMSVRGGFFFAC